MIDRTTLISFRFIAAFAGTALVNKFTLPLVEYLGQGNETLGWQLTMLLYGCAATMAFIITFLTTKERIAPPVGQRTSPIDDIKDLLNNRPWLILIALAMIIMMTITLRGGSAYYYFMYYVERPELISNYLFVQGIALGVGAALTPVMTKFIDKTKLLMILMSIVGALSIGFYFVPVDAIELMFTFNILIDRHLPVLNAIKISSMIRFCIEFSR